MIYIFIIIAIILTIIFLFNCTRANFLQKIQVLLTLCIVAMLLIIYTEILHNGTLIENVNNNLTYEGATIRQSIKTITDKIDENYTHNIETLQQELSEIKTTVKSININTPLDNLTYLIQSNDAILRQYALTIFENIMRIMEEIKQ